MDDNKKKILSDNELGELSVSGGANLKKELVKSGQTIIIPEHLVDLKQQIAPAYGVIPKARELKPISTPSLDNEKFTEEINKLNKKIQNSLGSMPKYGVSPPKNNIL